jgi:hypothetical protein
MTPPPETESAKKAAWESAFLVCFVLVLVTVLDLSRIQRHHNSDSLIHTLGSIYRWMPFPWGQDRLGTPTAFLLQPFKNPVTNALLHAWFSILGGVSFPFLVAKYLRLGRMVPVIGSGACLVLIVSLNSWEQFRYFIGHQEHTVPMALGLAGLLLMQTEGRFRIAEGLLSVLFLLVSAWVNPASVFALIPLVILREMPESWQVPRTLQATGVLVKKAAAHLYRCGALTAVATLAACTVISFIVSYIFRLEKNMPSGSFVVADLSTWPHAWVMLVTKGFREFLGWRFFAVIGALCALALLVGWMRGGMWSRLRRSLYRLVPMLAAALSFTLVMGTNGHIANNEFNTRYVIMPAMLLVISAITLCVGLALEGTPLLEAKRRPTYGVVFAGLLVAVILVHGFPKVSAFEDSIDARWGDMAREVVQMKATHVIGNYWDVWPTVLYGNLLKRRAGDPTLIYGLTNRGLATEPYWRESIPPEKMRIAMPNNSYMIDVGFYISHFKLPRQRTLSKHRTISILVPER